ncbi:GPI-anchored wall transfer protein 1 [Rhynchospora pubera]|uniref:GPI-anchored wall transfer protein 1 n=1 Tax=Rhynchospora pubera TaxID=906938 RepID=A0AAV8HZN7_9POAL|nr:GPI-anchored wall transfer protein 1 [Rhynchospora pubera]
MDLFETPLNPNKRLKEEFVSNLTGSSMLEIAALSTIVPGLVVLRKWNSSCLLNDYVQGFVKNGKNVKPSPKGLGSHLAGLALDYIFLILPILLFFTLLAEWCYQFAILIILLVLFRTTSKRSKFCSKAENSQLSSFRSIISSYRVSVVVVTCLCILAVDFKIFPRRYAKTETYGTGLMDLGVGSFVVTNALVSKQARDFKSSNVKAALQSISPLILLGFGRLISTTGVDYQVHVGEYGVHWNFFFTLAAVSILSSFVRIHPKYCGLLGFLILSGYQMILAFGLSEYLTSSKREANLISQNKEGIFSIFGYWGMYLISVYFGHKLLFRANSSGKDVSPQYLRIKIWALATVFWTLTIIFDNYVQRASRRMCNMAYVAIVLAQNFQVLSVLTLADLGGNLVLEDAFNQNLLGSFLLANILTGMVNLSMDTLSASPVTALIILLAYSFVLCFSISMVSFFGIRLKFW